MADATDEIGIARAAEADVVREDHGAEHVAMAVDGVDAVDDGNGEARLERVLLALVVDVGPSFEAIAFLGIGAAAAENRADEILFDVAEVVLDVLELRLGHLADLFVERHLGDDRFDQWHRRKSSSSARQRASLRATSRGTIEATTERTRAAERGRTHHRLVIRILRL